MESSFRAQADTRATLDDLARADELLLQSSV
jgi:hypothetical protein